MQTLEQQALRLYETDRRTSTFFPRTALKQGATLSSLRALADRYVQFRVLQRNDTAEQYLNVIRGHLDLCRSGDPVLPPYTLPSNVDKLAFEASSGMSPEEFARTLTRYEVRRFECFWRWFSEGSFPAEDARTAIRDLERINETLKDPSPENDSARERTWQFLRLLIQIGAYEQAHIHCLKLWPSGGTWRLPSLQHLPEHEYQTALLRMVSHGLKNGSSEVLTELQRRLDELTSTFGKLVGFVATGLSEFSSRLEYIHIRRLLRRMDPALPLLLEDLRGIVKGT